MQRSTIFWMLMILWLLFGLGVLFWPSHGAYLRGGYTLLEFVLFALLGWQVYGPAIKGG